MFERPPFWNAEGTELKRISYRPSSMPFPLYKFNKNLLNVGIY
jgi:hypothetical protein